MKKTIEITQKDIDGEFYYVYDSKCAVERAMCKEYSYLSPRARYGKDFSEGKLYLFTRLGHCQIANLPDEVCKLMKGFDGCVAHKKYLKPTSFEIEFDQRIQDYINEH